MVLVDTSVWIEFFKRHPTINLNKLELLLEERTVATAFPIQAEVLSGKMRSQVYSTVKQAFASMTFVDLDLNSAKTWQDIVDLAKYGEKKGIGIPGLIDRMILLSAKQSGAALWTLDRKLKNMAATVGVILFH